TATHFAPAYLIRQLSPEISKPLSDRSDHRYLPIIRSSLSSSAENLGELHLIDSAYSFTLRVAFRIGSKVTQRTPSPTFTVRFFILAYQNLLSKLTCMLDTR